MGATWSVTFVSKEKEEVQVPVDILCSASVVWRERLQLAGSLLPTPRAEEQCTAEEIKAFVTVISAHSQDTSCESKAIPFETLTKALPLVHKYDCTGTKRMLDELDSIHFSDPGMKQLKHHVCNQQGQAVVLAGAQNGLTEPWLTQASLDYLVLKQELYCEHNKFPKCVKELLASLLTRKQVVDRSTLNANASYLLPGHTSALVNVELSESSTPGTVGEESAGDATPVDKVEPKGLVIQAWRLTGATYMGLVPYLQPNFALTA